MESALGWLGLDEVGGPFALSGLEDSLSIFVAEASPSLGGVVVHESGFESSDLVPYVVAVSSVVGSDVGTLAGGIGLTGEGNSVVMLLDSSTGLVVKTL